MSICGRHSSVSLQLLPSPLPPLGQVHLSRALLPTYCFLWDFNSAHAPSLCMPPSASSNLLQGGSTSTAVTHAVRFISMNLISLFARAKAYPDSIEKRALLVARALLRYALALAFSQLDARTAIILASCLIPHFQLGHSSRPVVGV